MIINLSNFLVGLTNTYRTLRELHRKHSSNMTLADFVALAAVEAANEGIRLSSKYISYYIRYYIEYLI